MASFKKSDKELKHHHEKSGSLIIVASLSNYKDKERIDIRQFYSDDSGLTFLPSKSGFQIPPEQFKDFLKMIQKFGKEVIS